MPPLLKTSFSSFTERNLLLSRSASIVRTVPLQLCRRNYGHNYASLQTARCSSRDNVDDDGATSSGSNAIPDALPSIGVDTDWREFRAKLVASSTGGQAVEEDSGSPSTGKKWAHSIPVPEKGALLLAHPMMFGETQKYFYKAVILLLEHNEKVSYGVILNRPSKYTLGEVVVTTPLPEFEDCRLWIGGDVGDNQVLLLHRHENLEGSVEIVKGIQAGGMESARAQVAAGKISSSDFRWFTCYSGWGPGQLDSECKRGVWFTAAASPDLLMMEPEEEDGTDLYYKVLELMGGDYQVLANQMKLKSP